MDIKYKGWIIEMKLVEKAGMEIPVFNCKELKLFNYHNIDTVKRIISNKMVTRTILRRN